ncbi:MAG: hypothetical protein WCL39_03530 [Armatimonadota bacterium]
MAMLECIASVVGAVSKPVLVAAMLMAPVAPSAVAAERSKDQRNLDWGVGTLTILSALSAQDMERLYGGRVVQLADLDATRRTRILEAVKLAMGAENYLRYIVEMPNDYTLGLSISPLFSVILKDNTMPVPIELPLYKLVPDLETAELRLGSEVGREMPHVDLGPPVDIAQIMAATSSEPDVRAKQVRDACFGALSPLAQRWHGAASSLPFLYSEFASSAEVDLATASDVRRSWVHSVYEKHKAIVDSRRGKANSAPVIPAWANLSAPSIRLTIVGFDVNLRPQRNKTFCLACQKYGIGWVLGPLR